MDITHEFEMHEIEAIGSVLAVSIVGLEGSDAPLARGMRELDNVVRQLMATTQDYTPTIVDGRELQGIRGALLLFEGFASLDDEERALAASLRDLIVRLSESVGESGGLTMKVRPPVAAT